MITAAPQQSTANLQSNESLNRSQSFMGGSGDFKPRSLNIAVRRQENERIERENHAFAKRLFSNHGSINKKQMDSAYAD